MLNAILGIIISTMVVMGNGVETKHETRIGMDTKYETVYQTEFVTTDGIFKTHHVITLGK